MVDKIKQKGQAFIRRQPYYSGFDTPANIDHQAAVAANLNLPSQRIHFRAPVSDGKTDAILVDVPIGDRRIEFVTLINQPPHSL